MNRQVLTTIALVAADWGTNAALLIAELFTDVPMYLWVAYGFASGVNSLIAYGPWVLRFGRRYGKVAVIALALR